MLKWLSVGILLGFLILHTGKIEAAQPLEASAAVDKIFNAGLSSSVVFNINVMRNKIANSITVRSNLKLS